MEFTKISSLSDLKNYADKMGIKSLVICRLNESKKHMLDPTVKNLIINLDNVGSGTHWVAVNKEKKLYFDSYAEKIPETLRLFDLKRSSAVKELQTINDSENCGWLCLLFLYYSNYKSNDDFYRLFRDVYT